MNIERIAKCIENLIGDEKSLENNVNLSVYGLDSLARVELVVLLEEEFGINFNDSDLTQKNFETISCIDDLIKKYEFK